MALVFRSLALRCVRCVANEVWVIVRPVAVHPEDIKLLLGLPWLWDVQAIFDIRASTLKIGDPARGEEIQTIVGPILAPMGTHRLALGPKKEEFDALNHFSMDEGDSPGSDGDAEEDSSTEGDDGEDDEEKEASDSKKDF